MKLFIFVKNQYRMSVASKVSGELLSSVQAQEIPDFLLKEEIEGIKFYFKGYKDVLNKTKKPEDIMGCSSLQAFIIEYLLDVLYDEKIRSKYRRFTNESGNHFAHRTNMQFDIAVYEKAVLTPDKISTHYVQAIPPAMVVEVDMDVELEGTGIKSKKEYLQFRTQTLLKLGVKKIIWILTRSKKVLVAEGDSWKMESWDTDLELLEGITFDIARHLEQEGVEL